MNCLHVRAKMIELADGTVPAPEAAALRSHIAECADCGTRWQTETRWRDRFALLPKPEMRPEFAAQAFARARATHDREPQRHSGFRTGFITAMAASLAMWVGTGLWTGTHVATETTEQLPIVRVALHQAASIDLVFQAPEDFGMTTIAMQLPPNFEIAGQPGIRELTFESHIKRGNNRLVIPVVATAPGAGEFSAKILHLGKQKEFRVRLDTLSRPLTGQAGNIRFTT